MLEQQVCRDEGVLGSLKHSAHNVTTALEQLMNMLHSGYNRADGVSVFKILCGAGNIIQLQYFLCICNVRGF